MTRVSVEFYRLYMAFDILPSATIWVGHWGDDRTTIWDLDISWLRWGVSIEWRRYKKEVNN